MTLILNANNTNNRGFNDLAGGMMQGSTGVFNAPSRHAIYHRIITESEGQNAYSWSKFLSYDQKNR